MEGVSKRGVSRSDGVMEPGKKRGEVLSESAEAGEKREAMEGEVANESSTSIKLGEVMTSLRKRSALAAASGSEVAAPATIVFCCSITGEAN
jgi:hypothetical protein